MGNKYLGRDIVVEFVTGDTLTPPSAGSYLRLGALRGKGLETSWDTTDVTADDSEGNQTENLATFINTTLSLDGISRNDDESNQDALEDYVNNSTDAANFQPYGWVKVTRPSTTTGNVAKVYTFRCMFSSFSIDGPYDGGTTFSCEVSAEGKVAITYTAES
jgi:predicted secreted protein